MAEVIRWHPALVEVVAKTLGNEMRVGPLWEVMRPVLAKKAEVLLTALLREGYEVRPFEDQCLPLADDTSVTPTLRPWNEEL